MPPQLKDGPRLFLDFGWPSVSDRCCINVGNDGRGYLLILENGHGTFGSRNIWSGHDRTKVLP